MNNDNYFYQHLRKNKLKDKDLFLWATHDIDGSFTGRIDIFTSGLHIFFIESSNLIRNAIKLYEEGFFDAAFYSVRSALELARIITYFSDKNDLRNSETYRNWIIGGKFPFDATIRNELEKSSNAYQEISEVLQEFFNKQKGRLKSVQKYIHKQGYKTFYERGFVNEAVEKKRYTAISSDFHMFLKNSLIEIALLRLCIDPFPILLRDKYVMYKIHFESITTPFSDNFVSKIIGKDKIKLYRSTNFYKSHFDHFKDNEEISEEAHILINHKLYNRKSWPIIKKQIHLFSKNNVLAVKIFNTSIKIANIYMCGGFEWYFSDTNSSRTFTKFDSKDLLKVKNSDMKINLKHHEAYLSYFCFKDEELWLEHNKPITKTDFSKIQKVIVSLLS